MSIQAGTHRLGPNDGTLRVKTGRLGAAKKAGHDLVIEVTSWEATIEVGKDPRQISLELTADAGSLRIRKGTGGVQALGEDDKVEIQKTIHDEVLTKRAIEFRSTGVEASDGGRRLRVTGDLKMAGKSHAVDFELSVSSEGQISGDATLKQTDWGIKPFTGLFGALKVADEVEVLLEASLPSA